MADHGATHSSKDERWDLILLRDAVRYQRWVLEGFAGRVRGRVLEIGGGSGNFTRWLVELADQVVVAEPDPEMCEEIATLGLPRVEARCTPMQSLGEERFDSVVMLNVLEHIEDDYQAIDETFRLLVPGGALCLLVPAHPSLYGTLDRRYDHYRRYTNREVREMLRRSGFDVMSCRYFNPLGAVGWWLVARVLKRQRLSRSAIVLSERLGVPIGKWFRDPPFGQSVIAVAARPASESESDPSDRP